MTSRVFNSIVRSALFVICSLVFSCDRFQEDYIRPTLGPIEYYTLPGSSVVIDLTSIAKHSFENSSLSISKSPSRGIVSTLDTLLLKYKPGLDFTDGEDRFVLSSNLITQTVIIHMYQRKEDFPCVVNAIEDKAKAKFGSSITIPVLENDRICGIDRSDVSISIHSNPLFGTVSVTGESIVYAPGPGFKSKDEFVYKLTAPKGNSATYGIISISERVTVVQILDAPVRASAMFFVDEKIGFLGGSGLYKTTDGGEHWNQIFGSTDVTYRFFTAIHFLDANVGFAVYNCPESAPCMSGLMRTTDGGSSWSEFQISSGQLYGVQPLSLFFTSAMTGYLAAVVYDFWYGTLLTVIRSDDAGQSWGEVASGNPGPFRTSIGFGNLKYGYLHLNNDILVTNDSGDSWTNSFSHENISSVDITAGDIICAIVNNTSAGTPSSSIVRSTDGSTWQDVANFSHEIGHVQFSPTGNVGITIGVTKTDAEPKILLINRSVDKGLTWTQDDAYDHINISFNGDPIAAAVPSDDVFYILWYGKIIKFSNP